MEEGDVAECEPAEHRDHDERSAGDDAGSFSEAEGYGFGCETGFVIAFLDPAEHEHVIVHGQSEEDAEHEQG